MIEGAARDWYPVLPEVVDLASEIPIGEIQESDIPKIIADAAQEMGVDPPDPGTELYEDLARKIRNIGENERDLKQLGDKL